MKEFYYGLPQVIWDDLCEKAEDLLQEEQLGNHLVGIYPAGNRIYGIESASPGLLCLYVDSVESLIDPFASHSWEDGFDVFHVGESNCPIIMVDIYEWVKWLWSRSPDWRAASFLHAIPFGRHCIHQDLSISDIMDAAYEAMKEINFMISTHMPEVRTSDGSIHPNHYLFYRAMANLYKTHSFLPNINPEWDEVVSADQLGAQYLDTEVLKLAMLGQNPNLNASDYILPASNYPYIYSAYSNNTIEKLRQAVLDFYRFQI